MVWQTADAVGEATPHGFVESVRTCLRKYDGFTGRAQRAEYWWFILFAILLQLVLAIATGALFGFQATGVSFAVRSVVGLLLLLPQIAVTVRRLHDIDRSGWWQLIALLPLVGAIILLVWACTRGTRGPNRFGPEPGAV